MYIYVYPACISWGSIFMEKQEQQTTAPLPACSTITVSLRPNSEQGLQDWLAQPHVWRSWAKLVGSTLDREGSTVTFIIVWRGLAEAFVTEWRVFQREIAHLVDWAASAEDVKTVLVAQED